MTFHTADFVLEDLMIKACFELSLSRRCSCYIHSCLAATEDNEFLFRCYCGCINRRIRHVGLEKLKIPGRTYLKHVSLRRVKQDSKLAFAVLSLEAVMKYVLSGAHWRSVTCMPSS